MIERYCWPTSNGCTISIAIEEMERLYRVTYVSIARGEQRAEG